MEPNELVLCHDCAHPSKIGEWKVEGNKRCPNPACFPGMQEANEARAAWKTREKEARAERQAKARGGGISYASDSAMMSSWYISNPLPEAKPLDRVQRPITWEAWQAAHDKPE